MTDTEAVLNIYTDPKEVRISLYNIELDSVDPYPEFNVEVDKKEYTASLLITKSQEPCTAGVKNAKWSDGNVVIDFRLVHCIF